MGQFCKVLKLTVFKTTMKSIVASLCVLAVVSAEPTADSDYGHHAVSYGFSHHDFNGYPHGYSGFQHFGKRSAEAEAEPGYSYFGYSPYSYGYAHHGYYGYPTSHHFYRRSADSDSDAMFGYPNSFGCLSLGGLSGRSRGGSRGRSWLGWPCQF